MRGERGIGSIFKRKESRFWHISLWVNGKVHRESARSTRIEDARALLMKRIEEFRLIPGLVPRVTVSEVLEDYLRDLDMRGAKAWRIFSKQAKHASEFLGHEHPDLVEPLRFYELQRHLRSKGLAPATVNGVLSFVRAAFRFAGRTGKVRRRIEFPRALPENNVRHGFLEWGDYQAILKELPDWAKDPFRFAYHSGWRLREVLSLRWDEVDLEGRVFRLDPDRSKNRETRTLAFIGEIPDVISRSLAARVVGLPQIFHRRYLSPSGPAQVLLAHPQLETIRRDRNAGATYRELESRYGVDHSTLHKFFSSPVRPENRALNAGVYDRTFRKACVAAGRPKILFHDCRRSAYRNLLRAGVLEKVAREMVGWRSMRMPNRYNVTSPRDLEIAAEMYQEYVDRKASEASEPSGASPFERGGAQ